MATSLRPEEAKTLSVFIIFLFYNHVVNYQTYGLRLFTWEMNIMQQLPDEQWKGFTGML